MNLTAIHSNPHIKLKCFHNIRCLRLLYFDTLKTEAQNRQNYHDHNDIQSPF